jgi:hypothetical protein
MAYFSISKIIGPAEAGMNLSGGSDTTEYSDREKAAEFVRTKAVDAGDYDSDGFFGKPKTKI